MNQKRDKSEKKTETCCKTKGDQRNLSSAKENRSLGLKKESHMGVANLRRSLSPLHKEVEAVLWMMKCMIGADNQKITFFTDCSDLVKMVFSPTE